MTLPTYAGHEHVWCGGDDVTVPTPLPKTEIIILPNGLLYVWTYVPYSLDDLTLHSSMCSVQGMKHIF